MFRKAERKKSKLRLGITGPSGSGKTWSALEIAFGMTTGDKIFFIDTESGRGELYQGSTSKYDPKIIFDYNYLRIDAPYSPEKYIEAIKAAEQEGCEVLIIDSLSHAWCGEGGILSIVEKAGGQFQNGWRVGTPKQNSLIDTIITSNLHIICNHRAKTEYAMETNEKGKFAPRKVGLAPIQRDQVEYEFTVFMNMSQEHIAHFTKDNTEMFDQEFIKPTPEIGKKLIEWLNTGIDEKQSFKNMIPQVVESIYNINSSEKLKECYLTYYKKYASKFPLEFEEIKTAKDVRKDQLEKNGLYSLTQEHLA